MWSCQEGFKIQGRGKTLEKNKNSGAEFSKVGENKVFLWAAYDAAILLQLVAIAIPAHGAHSRGCTMNGKLYPLGHIERTENCLRCNCNEAAIQCCSLFFTPVRYDTKNCKVIFSKKRCNYDVVYKDDPSKMCYSNLARVG